MITFQAVIRLIDGVKARELRYWIEEGWVRPELQRGEYVFREIDIARARLIRELHGPLAIERDSIPVVLHLLDQLFAIRRRLRVMEAAVAAQPPAVQRTLRATLGKTAARTGRQKAKSKGNRARP